MSKPVNTSLIGAFVLGALALLIAAVAIFGSGKLFTKTSEYVLLFDTSVSGLNVGAPVQFRGVPIGNVSRIDLEGNLDTLEFRTAVYIKIVEQAATQHFFGNKLDPQSDAYMLSMITKGLRARLAPQSILTGQLMVTLNFYSNDIAGPTSDQLNYYNGIPELPTIPSQLDNIMQAISKLPVEEIGLNLLNITRRVDAVLSSDDVTDIANNLAAISNRIKDLLETDDTEQLFGQTGSLLTRLDESLNVFTKAGERYSLLADNANKLLAVAFTDLSSSMRTFNGAVKSIDEAAKTLRTTVSPTGAPVVELSRMIREMSEAARAIRSLAAMLDRNPEALLRGKGTTR